MSERKEFEIDLYDIYIILKKRLIILLASFLLGIAALAAFAILRYEPIFRATARIYIMPRDDNSLVTASGVQMGAFLIPDFAVIATQPPVSNRVVEKLKLPMSERDAASRIEVTNPADSRILAITAKTSDPLLSREMANAFAEESVIYLNELINSDSVVMLHEARIPDTPDQNGIMRTALVGGIGLLVLTGLIVVIKEMTDGKIKTARDVERYFGQPAFVSVPKSKGRKKACNTIKDRILLLGDQIHTILFACSGETEGAMELMVETANTLVKSGKKILIVDCNLRGNKLAEIYPKLYFSESSLAEYLSSDVKELPVISGNEVGWDAVFSGGPNERPLELLMTEKFTDLLERLNSTEYYDYILLCTAPLRSGLEGSYLSDKIDKTIFVVRHKRTIGAKARDELAQMKKSGGNVMGVILTDNKSWRSYRRELRKQINYGEK